MKKQKITVELLLKAIKKHCLGCSCDRIEEVEKCVLKDCPLYLYRLGKRTLGNKGKNKFWNQKN